MTNKAKILHAALFTPISRNRWGLPLLFRGPPGVAKTQSCEAAGKAGGLKVEILSPGERGEGAFGVVPVPTTINGRTLLSYPAPEWTLGMAERGLVIIDEISCFPAGTPVHTPQGQRPIEQLRVGDAVWSCALQRGMRRANLVSGVMQRRVTALLTLELTDGTTIRCTPDHPIYSEGRWIPAEQLRAGSTLVALRDLLAADVGPHSDASSEAAWDDGSGVSHAVPCSTAGGPADVSKARGGCGGNAARTDGGSSVCCGEACARNEAGRDACNAFARSECNNSAQEHGNVPREDDRGGAGRSGIACSCSGSEDPSKSIADGRAGCGSVLAQCCGARDGVNQVPGGLEARADGLDSSEEPRAHDLRADPVRVPHGETDANRTGDDHVSHCAQDRAAVHGGWKLAGTDPAGGAQKLAGAGLCGSAAARGDSARPLNALGASAGSTRLSRGGLADLAGSCAASPDSGRTGGADPQLPAFVRVHRIQRNAVSCIVYDLTVERDHNFFAGAGGTLVHNCAPPALQPPLLGLIQERMIGGQPLASGVRVLATANPTDQAAGGWDLAMPVANRLGHINWEAPTAEEWTNWLLGGGESAAAAPIDPAAEEARVLAAWGTPWATARGLVAGFVKRKSDLLLKVPEANSPAASQAWPSPRSWEAATRAFAASKIHGLSAGDRDTLVAAFVGDGPAGEFLTYATNMDLPDPAEILDGKAKWKHNPHRLDISDAVLSSCTALVTGDAGASQKVRAAKMWALLETLMDDAADLVEAPARALAGARLLGAASMKTLAKLNPILVAVK